MVIYHGTIRKKSPLKQGSNNLALNVVASNFFKVKFEKVPDL